MPNPGIEVAVEAAGAPSVNPVDVVVAPPNATGVAAVEAFVPRPKVVPVLALAAPNGAAALTAGVPNDMLELVAGPPKGLPDAGADPNEKLVGGAAEVAAGVPLNMTFLF